MASKKFEDLIYIVNYWRYEFEDDVCIPLKAFLDRQKAEDFKEKCIDEAIRVVDGINNYWKENQAEFDKVSSEVREIIYEHRKLTEEGKEKSKITAELCAGERRLALSHKYHPEFCTVERDVDYSYEIQTIELVT